ncbi:hypothetical protein [Aquimarina macrocephali]|uniref:hypothetical protein n=1 Tax=Aquimarina macrocephali TaxID=666563 RepID=UPI0004B75233|nr:hypothetical protein [Aquimarina macrocephali]
MSNLSAQTPKKITVIISIVLVLLGLLGSRIHPVLAENSNWLVLAGYVLLLLGVYLKGL